MLLFNKPESAKERSKTPELSLQAENNVVDILNRCLFGSDMIDAGSNEHNLLQQFIYHYENLCHHHACTFGLWACESPDDVIDPSGKLFKIK